MGVDDGVGEMVRRGGKAERRGDEQKPNLRGSHVSRRSQSSTQFDACSCNWG